MLLVQSAESALVQLLRSGGSSVVLLIFTLHVSIMSSVWPSFSAPKARLRVKDRARVWRELGTTQGGVNVEYLPGRPVPWSKGGRTVALEGVGFDVVAATAGAHEALELGMLEGLATCAVWLWCRCLLGPR